MNWWAYDEIEQISARDREKDSNLYINISIYSNDNGIMFMDSETAIFNQTKILTLKYYIQIHIHIDVNINIKLVVLI